MLRQRFLLYFSAVAALTLVATVAGEAFIVQRAVDHSRRADLRFATGVAHHVSASLEEEGRHLASFLDAVPFASGERAVVEFLQSHQESMFEQGGLYVFAEGVWAVGAEFSPGGQAPPELLLPALRAARSSEGLAVTSLWEGQDGKPRVSLVRATVTEGNWRAAVGNVRLDQPAFLSNFGFFLKDQDVRLQILDASGKALFSTVEEERYKSVVHGTYLLDRVRRGEVAQLKCHGCHDTASGLQTKEEEVSTLAPVAGTSWSVLVRENPKPMREMLRETVIIIVLLVCLILGAFLGFYWLLTRRVLKPLRQLASAASSLHAQEAHVPPPVGGKDEMEILSESFDAMVNQVKAVRAPEVPPKPPLPVEHEALPPKDLKESLRRALALALDGFGKVEIISALVVVVEGEPLGATPLVVGTAAERLLPLVPRLRELGAEKEVVTPADLASVGLGPSALGEVDSFFRSELHAQGRLHGFLWVGSTQPEAARHLRPISVLLTLHLQGLLDRSLLLHNLWLEHRQKSRMLGHLFEAEAEERKRIAREIHDDTAQALTALLLLLETFPFDASPDKQEEAIRTAKERVGEIIDSTDRILRRLRPALLDDLGLVDAVWALGSDSLENAGIDFEFDAPDEDIRASPEIEDAVFRVFQEATSNVVRHAQATRVQASLKLQDGRIIASFEDNGRGLVPDPTRSFGGRPRFGLLGMRERIDQVGGTLELSAPSGGGLRIELSVPYIAAPERRLLS